MAKDFVSELSALLKFLRSLWGLLGGMSVFFPLSGSLFGLIPLEAREYSLPTHIIRNTSLRELNSGASFDSPYGVALLPPRLIVTIATIVTIFMVFQTIASRDDFRKF